MEKLNGCIDGESPSSITDEVEYATFDLAGDFEFSEQFQCLDNPDNRSQIHLLQSHVKIFAMNAMRRVLGVAKVLNFFENALTSLKPCKTVYQKKVTMWITKRLEGEQDISSNDKEDLITVLARSTDPRNGLSFAEAENSLSDFMIAGTDTIATTVSSALYNLLQVPDVMTELQAEVCDAAEHSSMDNKNLAQLPLLDAVIDEAMRLAPATPSALSRRVPEPGSEICGYFMPPGVCHSLSSCFC